MAESDEWGRDPAVKMMRRVFGCMERCQGEFLKAHGISPYDVRLRSWREKTLRVFERSWAEMTRRRVNMDEERAGALYVHLLAREVASEGVSIESGGLPQDRDMEKWLREVGL